jgi:hypothetical protein
MFAVYSLRTIYRAAVNPDVREQAKALLTSLEPLANALKTRNGRYSPHKREEPPE